MSPPNSLLDQMGNFDLLVAQNHGSLYLRICPRYYSNFAASEDTIDSEKLFNTPKKSYKSTWAHLRS